VLYLEHYTSILAVGKEELEKLYGKKVVLADRETCEDKADVIIDAARNKEVAFLVVGSPFAATTHMDLMIRAHKKGVKTSVAHNASIMNSVAACGLQLYSFGATVSICLFEEKWRPASFYQKIADNQKLGLHSMCLLDIKIKEISYSNLMKGVSKYEKPRFLTTDMACRQMLEVEGEKKCGILTTDTPIIAVCRAGQTDQLIASGTIGEFAYLDFGAPLHTLVVPGHMHILERDMFSHFHWRNIHTLSTQAVKIPEKISNISPRFLAAPGEGKVGAIPLVPGSGDGIPKDVMQLIYLLSGGGEECKDFQEHLLASARSYLAANPGILAKISTNLGGTTTVNSNNNVSDADDTEEVGSAGGYQERLLEQRRRRKLLPKTKVEESECEEDEDEDEDDDDGNANNANGNSSDPESLLFQATKPKPSTLKQ